MILSISNIMIIYLIISSTMILFDIGYALTRKINGYVEHKKKQYWRYQIKSTLRRQVAEGALESHRKLVSKRLKKLRELRAYVETLEALEKSGNQETLQHYKQSLKETYLSVFEDYMSRKSLYKAYCIYVYKKNGLIDTSEPSIAEQYRQMLMACCLDQSIYCRENALQALYALGNEDDILQVLSQMDIFGIRHHEKLIYEGLLTFNGDRGALASKLLEVMNTYSIELQVTIVRYCTVISNQFSKQLRKILEDDTTDREVKYAVMRYFKKWFCKGVDHLLIQYLDEKTYGWEAVTIALSALGNYPSNLAREKAVQALTSENWYIRNSAAEALVNMGMTPKEEAQIAQLNDPYAIQMLESKETLRMRGRELKVANEGGYV